jgi:hypothetical protein
MANSIKSFSIPANIVIIANSENILDKKFGDKINNFDTVIRVGKYNIKGFEEYIGNRTDIVSTIYYNIRECDKDKKLILVNHYNLNDTTRIIPNIDLNLNNIIYTHTRDDDKEITNFFKNNLTSNIEIPNCNFSLGFRTIFLVLKLFSTSKIYIHGFDFFKTGYYFNPNHNRNIGNKHPYLYERLCVKKLIHSDKLYELS